MGCIDNHHVLGAVEVVAQHIAVVGYYLRFQRQGLYRSRRDAALLLELYVETATRTSHVAHHIPIVELAQTDVFEVATAQSSVQQTDGIEIQPRLQLQVCEVVTAAQTAHKVEPFGVARAHKEQVYILKITPPR